MLPYIIIKTIAHSINCLRYMGKMDKEIFNKAIQGYVKD